MSEIIVFDCGVVLTDHGDTLDQLAALAEVPREVLEPAYWGHRQAYDAGQADLPYWATVLRDCGRRCDAELAARLTDVDQRTWSTIRPAARDILAALARQGRRHIMLSNAAPCFRSYLEELDWTASFEALVISGELGVTKPDPAIYAVVEELAGDASLRFVDDRPENVDAAAARGWDAHLWVDDADTAAWLGLV